MRLLPIIQNETGKQMRARQKRERRESRRFGEQLKARVLAARRRIACDGVTITIDEWGRVDA